MKTIRKDASRVEQRKMQALKFLEILRLLMHQAHVPPASWIFRGCGCRQNYFKNGRAAVRDEPC